MAGKIYVLGGYQISDLEEKVRRATSAKLKEIFDKDVGRKGTLELVVVDEPCDAKTFKAIWQRKDTVGIFWLSHAEPNGALAAFSPESWRELAETGRRYELLNPIDPKFPNSGPNLKFAALLACGSAQLEDAWRRKMTNPAAQLKTFAAEVRGGEDFSDFRNNLNKWINGIEFRKPKQPTTAARYLFEYASGDWSTRVTGCSCEFGRQVEVGPKHDPRYPIIVSEPAEEPIHRFVPYRIIPKVVARLQDWVTGRHQAQEQGRRMVAEQARKQGLRIAEMASRQAHEQARRAAEIAARRAQDEARQRSAQAAARRQVEETARQRARRETERRQAEENARRAREAGRRKLPAIELARFRRPPAPSRIWLPVLKPTRRPPNPPRIWQPVLKSHEIIAGPPYIGGKPMGSPTPDWITRFKRPW